MKLLHSRVFLALSIAALIFLILSALTWSWEYVLEGAEGILGFGLLFFLISSVMKTKHIAVYSDSENSSEIGTLVL